jgi:hypothetical protein
MVPLRRRIALWISAVTLALTATWAPPAAAEPVEVDVELVLAVDVSYSMDPQEQRLQREGYVQAILSQQFMAAIRSGPYGRISITYMQWASATDHDVVLPWTLIDGPETARAVADRLSEAPYRRARRTSISGAIDEAMRLFETSNFKGLRRIIDVSGDGANNDGRPVAAARDDAVRQGVVINGLPVLVRPSSWGFADIANLDEYYEDCVIGGPGSFSIPIRSQDDFLHATRTKLVQEIAHAPPVRIDAPRDMIVRTQRREPRVDCMVGERMWRDRWGN